MARLKIANLWKIAQVMAFLLMFILCIKQLQSSSQLKQEWEQVKKSMNTNQLPNPGKLPQTFEEKVETYRKQKVEKLKEEALMKGDTEKRTRSISNDYLNSPDVMKSLKNPQFGNVDEMAKYFDPNKILKLGKKRKEKAYAVFGIPTVSRKNAYYIMNTLKSLINNLSEDEKQEVVIIIFIAENNQQYIDKVVGDIKRDFTRDVDSGLLQVIIADPAYYPNLDKLPRLYGDKPDRVKWRSKQSLDYSFLYYYCFGLGEYFIQLEDDILAEEQYFVKMKRYIRLNKNEKWSVLEFGARGYIGMTYEGQHLLTLAKFVRSFFWLMPVDWLFRVYNSIYLNGNPKKFKYKPPMFKHVGVISSLKGQVRKLDDFKKKKGSMTARRRFQSPKGNPDGLIRTTIAEFAAPHSIDAPYGKEGVFWGKSLKHGDSVEIVLTKPQFVKRIVFSSGTPGYTKDVFASSELYVSTKLDMPCDDYKLAKEFTSEIVDYTFSEVKTPVTCIKLVLTKVSPKNWLIIEEIAVLI